MYSYDSITLASNVDNPYLDALNIYPAGFRYTVSGTTIYGQFVQEPGISSYYYYDYTIDGMYGTSVPAGWLMALQYVKDGAHVKLIVPSKSGHSIAQQKVYLTSMIYGNFLSINTTLIQLTLIFDI